MNIRSIRGEVVTIVVIGLAVAAWGGWFLGHKTSSSTLTAAGKAVMDNQNKQDAAVAKITGEKTAEAKTGQQLTSAGSAALDAAPPDVQKDPAVDFARKAIKKAGTAFDFALGPLTPEQQKWVATIVADATSAASARQAAAERALGVKDGELQQSIEHVGKLESELADLRSERTKLDQALAAHDAEASAFRARVFFWIWILGGGYVFIAFVLPVLSKAFPVFGGIARVFHGIWAGLWAKTLSEAHGLAEDASGAVHSIGEIVKRDAPQVADKVIQETKDWITPSDGTDARYRAALTEIKVL